MPETFLVKITLGLLLKKKNGVERHGSAPAALESVGECQSPPFLRVAQHNLDKQKEFTPSSL